MVGNRLVDVLAIGDWLAMRGRPQIADPGPVTRILTIEAYYVA